MPPSNQPTTPTTPLSHDTGTNSSEARKGEGRGWYGTCRVYTMWAAGGMRGDVGVKRLYSRGRHVVIHVVYTAWSRVLLPSVLVSASGRHMQKAPTASSLHQAVPIDASTGTTPCSLAPLDHAMSRKHHNISMLPSCESSTPDLPMPLPLRSKPSPLLYSCALSPAVPNGVL